MIEYYTGTPNIPTPKLEPYEPASIEYISTPLEIKPNSVIVLRCPRDYSADHMNCLIDYYKQIFPNNKICVIHDDIDISIINDNSWTGRPCAEHTGDYYG